MLFVNVLFFLDESTLLIINISHDESGVDVKLLSRYFSFYSMLIFSTNIDEEIFFEYFLNEKVFSSILKKTFQKKKLFNAFDRIDVANFDKSSWTNSDWWFVEYGDVKFRLSFRVFFVLS